MIQPLLEAITDELKHRQPRFQTGISLGFIDREGRILTQTQPDRNEFEWAGISDNLENYFYIRHRSSGNISHESTGNTKQFSSCNPNSIQLSRYELKLVACLRNFCPYTMERQIRDSLITARFPSIAGVSKIAAMPINSDVNSMGVVEEEAGKPKQFDPNLIFVSVDFDLTMEIAYF